MKQNLKIVAVEPIGIGEQKRKEIENKLAEYHCSFTMYNDRKEDERSLCSRIADNDVAIVSNIPLNAKVLSKCPNLKLLAVAFTGIDHIDTKYCAEHDIQIINASGYATEAVAELAIGLMLDLSRKITSFDSSIRKRGTRNNFLGAELSGKTVGIVGMGAIGKRCALLLTAFGCKVLAYSRRQTLVMSREGVEYTDLEDLVRRSDIVSLHVPLTEQTNNLIDEKLLSLFKPSAILINTARGKVVDYRALAQALKEGRIAGAATDVYENEPPLEEDYPLLKAPNCICVPHIAYATEESFEKRIDIVLNNITTWLSK